MTETIEVEALPDHAYVLSDRSGYDELRSIFVLRMRTGEASGDSGSVSGIRYGLWSDPDPDVVPLVYGPWDGDTAEQDLVTGRWSDG